MPFADDLASTSVMMSLGIALIAAFLGLHQWYERQAREPDLSDRDRHYFFRQDVRRGMGVAVMLILAAGLSIGARIAPRVNGRANLTFVEFWLGVIGLLVVLIILAGLDWLATRLYARRKRQSMARERIELLREAIREAAAMHSEPSGGIERGPE
jgi:small-conductance mechanosensitive channel